MPSLRALIADDEPLLRETLKAELARAWPALEVVAMARNGREAIRLFDEHQPEVCFFDVQMPGIDGIAAARHIGRRAQIVFVTAFDQYAIEAFAQGVVDYLVKPVEPVRLAETVRRLRERLASPSAPPDLEALLEKLSAARAAPPRPEPLRWIRAQIGSTLRLIPVEDIDYLRADQKYTRVAWRDEGGQAAEALLRVPLRELLEQLDLRQFAQVHRSAVVNLRAIHHVERGDNETATIHLRQRRETLPVSRAYAHLFRQM